MTWPRRPVYCLTALMLTLGCVPRENGDGNRSGSDGFTGEGAPVPRWRPRPRVQSRSLPDSGIGVSAASGSGSASATTSARLQTTVFRDNFDREQLGPEWTKTSERWVLHEGRVCGQSIRNHPLWLNLRLPTNARIEFSAQSFSKEGDIKVEAWGNGRSFAHGTTYNDATSYLFILGGWKNQLHVLARLNEHGDDRLELPLDETGNGPGYAPVEPGRSYRFVIERRDGHTVSWHLDGKKLLSFEDPNPLQGSAHDHFGFNGWETEVCFDNLLITPVAE